MDTYRSIHDTYHWTLKHYPGTDYLVSSAHMDDIIGTATTTRYRKSGSRWVETGNETEEISRRHYFNSIDAVPFFRCLGGREIVSMSYTRYGYIPYEVISISPDRTERIKRTFHFE